MRRALTVVPLVALVLDRVAGEPPPSLHPVVWMGRCLTDRAAGLRAVGIGVRDAASFGMPTALRLSAQPPGARAALRLALASA